MSERAERVQEAPPASPRAAIDWRQRYESTEAQRAALADQVRQLEQVRKQLASYAGDLNHTYLEFRRRLQQMRVLHEVSLRIGAPLDADAVARATVEALQRLVPVDTAHVFLQEPGGYAVRARVSWAPPRRRPGAPTARMEELIRDAMDSGRPRTDSVGGAATPTAILVVPLRAQGRALGGLCLARASGSAFDDEAVQVVELLAATCAAALANAALYEQSQRLALTDPLTGLYNRRSLEGLLEQELDKAHRLHYPVGVLVVDVDRFKRINDRLGHLEGDNVLGAIADALRRALRRFDLLGRFGGDEFVAVLPGCDVEAAHTVGEKLRGAVARLRIPGPQVDGVTISIGGAAAEGPDAGPLELLEAADRALYRAKAAGRNRVIMAGATVSAAQTAASGG